MGGLKSTGIHFLKPSPQPEGDRPVEYLKNPQSVTLRLGAFFDPEIPFPNVCEKYTQIDNLKSL
jgi:hypothetical protein